MDLMLGRRRAVKSIILIMGISMATVAVMDIATTTMGIVTATIMITGTATGKVMATTTTVTATVTNTVQKNYLELALKCQRT